MKDLCPPKLEKDTLGCWYGVIYYAYKKPQLYIGRAIKRFLIDENGTVEAFQIDCLKPRVGTGTVLEGIPYTCREM